MLIQQRFGNLLEIMITGIVSISGEVQFRPEFGCYGAVHTLVCSFIFRQNCLAIFAC